MSNHVRTRIVSDQWTWFTDYVFLWANWTVNCEAGRQCQVGMGIFTGGEPRGEKIRFGPHKQFTTVGVGAIHIRVVDGKGPCTVRLDQGKVGLIPIINTPIDLEVGLGHQSEMTDTDLLATSERFNAACQDLQKVMPTMFPPQQEQDSA